MRREQPPLQRSPITLRGNATSFFLPLKERNSSLAAETFPLHVSGSAINQLPAGFRTKLAFDVFPRARDRFYTEIQGTSDLPLAQGPSQAKSGKRASRDPTSSPQRGRRAFPAAESMGNVPDGASERVSRADALPIFNKESAERPFTARRCSLTAYLFLTSSVMLPPGDYLLRGRFFLIVRHNHVHFAARYTTFWISCDEADVIHASVTPCRNVRRAECYCRVDDGINWRITDRQGR